VIIGRMAVLTSFCCSLLSHHVIPLLLSRSIARAAFFVRSLLLCFNGAVRCTSSLLLALSFGNCNGQTDGRSSGQVVGTSVLTALK